MGDRIRMRAKDSFFSSETRQVNSGKTFELDSIERAKELVSRGLASFIDAVADIFDGDNERDRPRRDRRKAEEATLPVAPPTATVEPPPPVSPAIPVPAAPSLPASVLEPQKAEGEKAEAPPQNKAERDPINKEDLRREKKRRGRPPLRSN